MSTPIIEAFSQSLSTFPLFWAGFILGCLFGAGALAMAIILIHVRFGE